jgi:predicted deacylase
VTASAAPGAAATAPHASAPPIEVAFPDLSRWAAGNAGVPYVWSFDAGERGPHVVVQALTHGNEVCGAIAVDRLLDEGLRPARGRVTFVFANVAAYRSFDHTDPYASRCVDEDYNRLWSADVLDGTRQTRDLARARELRPVIDRADALLDLHSMTDPCPPLALAGTREKGLKLARAVGVPATIVIDAGHAAGKRLRDYAFFDEPADPRAALLVECGQHWERAAPDVAMESTLRFLAHYGTIPRAELVARVGAAPPPPQRAITITQVITIVTDRFAFAMPVHGMMVVPKAGTTIARDGAATIATPHDDCVLIMPTRRPKVGETAVRLGRFV